MDFKDVKELIKIFDASALNSLSITQENTKIKLKKGLKPSVAIPTTIQPQNPPSPQIQAPAHTEQAPATQTTQTPRGDTINSPMVGTFYRCPSPNTPAYVNVGDKVKKGQTLGIIEAMKIMNEIEAEFDCKILEIIPNDSQPVEYNSPLFVVEKL